jgi:predicted XRE-type DNA-binding protein
MLTGKELGKAIAEAIRRKEVSKAAVARHFGIKPPSISDWINRGTIDKSKLDDLFLYFSDVADREHWGLSLIHQAPQPAQFTVRESTPHHHRPLVQQVCDLAETIDDAGLRNLIDIARCLARNHPAAKAKRA